RDERPAGTRRERVDGARRELLAGAARPRDQHVARAARDGGELIAQDPDALALADEPVRVGLAERERGLRAARADGFVLDAQEDELALHLEGIPGREDGAIRGAPADAQDGLADALHRELRALLPHEELLAREAGARQRTPCAGARA